MSWTKSGENDARGKASAGLAGWLITRLRGEKRQKPNLELLERITLAPRQTLTLIEADGRRLLIATSADGTPAFFALDSQRGTSRPTPGRERASW